MTLFATTADPAAPPSHVPTTAIPARKAGAASWYTLAVLLVATILGSVDAMLVTLLTEPMRATLSLSDTQIGMLKGGGLVLFTGLATLPLGWLGDRYDRRVVLAACVLVWSAATGLRGTAMDYTMLFVASIGLGVGEAGLGPITNSLIPDLFPRAQRVLANAIFGISSIFGSALGAVLGGSIVLAVEKSRHLMPAGWQGYETWRLTFFVMAFVGLPVILLVLTIRSARGKAAAGYEPPTAESAEPVEGNASGASAGSAAPVAAVGADGAVLGGISFRDYLRAHWRTLACLVAGSGLASVGLSSIGSWIPIVAARQFGIQPAQLGQGIGIAVMAGTLVGGVLGVKAMRMARRRVGLAAPVRVLVLGYGAAALISIGLLFVRSATDVFVLLAMLLVPLICGAVVLPNVLQEVAPPHLRARVIGVLSMGTLPFAVLGPLAIGVISDAVKNIPNGLAMAIVAATLTGCLSGALLLRATEPAFVRLLKKVNATS
ncbi:MAG: MFS transporter [Mitsuaria chitosanitabida]|uniref:MFS transporter n=1 Tax=Roseateles chitosanitabidus TaxID=65048 RepID=UPI001B160483|nr:MFS transporter [Roseateles chitosanitabidus]MBO9689267.1 MFS transporter [Roseateles chitosanitabidus]